MFNQMLPLKKKMFAHVFPLYIFDTNTMCPPFIMQSVVFFLMLFQMCKPAVLLLFDLLGRGKYSHREVLQCVSIDIKNVAAENVFINKSNHK